VHTGFWWRNVRERDNSQNLGVDGNIILRWIFRKLDWGKGGAMNWMELAQVRDRWWAVVNVEMNLWGSVKLVEFHE